MLLGIQQARQDPSFTLSHAVHAKPFGRPTGLGHCKCCSSAPLVLQCQSTSRFSDFARPRPFGPIWTPGALKRKRGGQFVHLGGYDLERPWGTGLQTSLEIMGWNHGWNRLLSEGKFRTRLSSTSCLSHLPPNSDVWFHVLRKCCRHPFDSSRLVWKDVSISTSASCFVHVSTLLLAEQILVRVKSQLVCKDRLKPPFSRNCQAKPNLAVEICKRKNFRYTVASSNRVDKGGLFFLGFFFVFFRIFFCF